MEGNREQKRARLLAKAEQLIEEYLVWEERHPRPDLTQIEDIALKLRKELGKEIAQLALEDQAASKPVPGPNCPECGQEMHYKGEKGNQFESRVGGLDLERGYYYCPACKAGLFPPG
jgi:hypothetical protein